MSAEVSEPVIRPYQHSDRAAVRRICFLTGYMGEPIGWQWRDEQSFSDMFSGYYTDCEPESALVVDIDGAVNGYLLGCVDSAKAWNAGTVAARHVLRRGIAFRRGTAAMIWRSGADVVLDVARRRVRPAELDFADERWPAHLHLDLLECARGRGAGRAMVESWLGSLRDAGVRGCHLQTMSENTTAVRFFESMGFKIHTNPIPAPGIRTPEGGRLHIQVMVLDLSKKHLRFASPPTALETAPIHL